MSHIASRLLDLEPNQILVTNVNTQETINAEHLQQLKKTLDILKDLWNFRQIEKTLKSL